jgi:hypothetical protein
MILRRQKRKLFWPLGLISLTLTPLWFFSNLKDNPAVRTYYTMEINLPPQNYNEYSKRWLGERDIDIPPHGRWNVIQIPNTLTQIDKIFDSLRIVVHQFNEGHDTLCGIEIRLNSFLSYNSFVKILDILNVEDISRYAIIRSSIWIPHFPRYKYLHKTNVRDFICGGVGLYTPPVPTFYERIEFFVSDIKSFWINQIICIPLPILITWVALLILNIFRINKWQAFNKHRG